MYKRYIPIQNHSLIEKENDFYVIGPGMFPFVICRQDFFLVQGQQYNRKPQLRTRKYLEFLRREYYIFFLDQIYLVYTYLSSTIIAYIYSFFLFCFHASFAIHFKIHSRKIWSNFLLLAHNNTIYIYTIPFIRIIKDNEHSSRHFIIYTSFVYVFKRLTPKDFM